MGFRRMDNKFLGVGRNKEESFVFKLKRSWDLDYEMIIPSKLIDHLLLPFYGLLTFFLCVVVFIPYTIFYIIKKCRKEGKGGQNEWSNSYWDL